MAKTLFQQHAPGYYGNAMKSAFRNTSTFGMPGAKQVPVKQPKIPKAKPLLKMQTPSISTSMSASTPMMKPKRQAVRSMASKLFGGRY